MILFQRGLLQWFSGKMVDHGTHETVVGRSDQNHNNKSYMIRISNTGQIVTRNSRHMNAIPITAKQYLRDQINKNTTDPLDEILKNYEKAAQENVSTSMTV